MNMEAILSSERIFLDADIFNYGALNKSAQCKQLLRRCAEKDVAGIPARNNLPR